MFAHGQFHLCVLCVQLWITDSLEGEEVICQYRGDRYSRDSGTRYKIRKIASHSKKIGHLWQWEQILVLFLYNIVFCFFSSLVHDTQQILTKYLKIKERMNYICILEGSRNRRESTKIVNQFLLSSIFQDYKVPIIQRLLS